MSAQEKTVTPGTLLDAQGPGGQSLRGFARLLQANLSKIQAGRPVFNPGPDYCTSCDNTGWQAKTDGRGVIPCERCRTKAETADPDVSRITGTVKVFKR